MLFFRGLENSILRKNSFPAYEMIFFRLPPTLLHLCLKMRFSKTYLSTYDASADLLCFCVPPEIHSNSFWKFHFHFWSFSLESLLFFLDLHFFFFTVHFLTFLFIFECNFLWPFFSRFTDVFPQVQNIDVIQRIVSHPLRNGEFEILNLAFLKFKIQ